MTGTGRSRLDADAHRRLEDLCRILVPADDAPGLEADALSRHVAAVGGAVAARFGAILRSGETDLDAMAAADRNLLIDLAAEAYYGAADAPGAAMVGFEAGATQPVPGFERPLTTTGLDSVADGFDVVVVGAGAGGSIVAAVGAAAGMSVLIVERGRYIDDASLGRDHLRNHRSPVRGINTGPERGTPRVVDGVVVEDPAEPSWHNNAVTVGGGTRVFGAVAWRFLPQDFAMASTYGVPEGSSLADWPITYDDLEPHYAWVEDTIGVAGDPTAHRHAGRRSGPYPLPPLSGSAESETLARGAAALGIDAGPVPVMINTVPRHGRGACVRCGECAGFACPTNARAGTQNTALLTALDSGNATLVDRARATRIVTGERGRVQGVELLDVASGVRRQIAAGHVVVAAGAIESARLLLASRGPAHPDGIGNRSDQVGRHLQGHAFVSAFGLFDEVVRDNRGPGIEIGSLDFAHRLHDAAGRVVGGGVITNELLKQPIVHQRWALPPDAARHGRAGKDAMRNTFGRVAHLFGHVQEIPVAGNRVTLAGVVDDAGERVAALAGRPHAETVRAAAAVEKAAGEWMEASGPGRVWTQPMPGGLSAGHHQAGTCRMGDDPAASVVDPTGRVHGHDNLWVADASLHVTNGSVNPSLTIMALAHRVATALAR